MKKILLLLAALYFAQPGSAQNTQPAPLVIQGKITNCPEKILKIVFEDENDKLIIDTIKLNDAGEFYLKTFHLKKPQRTSIQQNRTQINNIYVAPGYNLTITGDASDPMGLYKSKKITGTGAATNQYRVLLDSIYASRNDSTRWYELKLEALLPFIKMRKALEDSLANAVFSRKPTQDPYFGFFKKSILLDNESMEYYTLLQHILLNQYSYEQITTLVKEHTPISFQQGVSNDDYLMSRDYKSWVLPLYINYTKHLDKLKDPTLAGQPDYDFNVINTALQGKVKDYYLQKAVNNAIWAANSIDKLNAAKKSIAPHLNALKKEGYKKDIAVAFDEKEKLLMLLQIGKPAPAFTVLSNTGKSYTLADFKGKVVYIDLWASWCGPCRAEIPNFKKLYNRYKDNDKITFIGIAVSDGEKEWRKALEEEKPDWLQLYDKHGMVSQSYVANAIPKYILIDKEGKVANFNAPGPGSEEIGKLIEQELAK